MKVKHLRKEQNIRLEEAEVMAKFTELSPDPILRCDKDGSITQSNTAAKNIFNLYEQNPSIGEVFPEVEEIDLTEILRNGDTFKYTTEINNT